MQHDIRNSAGRAEHSNLNRPWQHPLRRTAAIGKAFVVYLFSGSLGIALLAFLIFKMMGW